MAMAIGNPVNPTISQLTSDSITYDIKDATAQQKVAELADTVDSKLALKQDKLTAGTNVVISEDNTISVEGRGDIVQSGNDSIAVGVNCTLPKRQVSATAYETIPGIVLIGSNSRIVGNISGASSTIVGAGASVGAVGGAVAVGYGSYASGGGAVAVGFKAKANEMYSVAIGNESTADELNTVSFGNSETKRKITNIAPATSSNEAVEYDQLNTALATKQDILQIERLAIGDESDYAGRIVQYVGTTDGTFTHGHFYESLQNESSGDWEWHEVETQSASGATFAVDDSLSTTSENPIQNKVVTTALNGKMNLLTQNYQFEGSYTSDLSVIISNLIRQDTKRLVVINGNYSTVVGIDGDWGIDITTGVIYRYSGYDSMSGSYMWSEVTTIGKTEPTTRRYEIRFSVLPQTFSEIASGLSNLYSFFGEYVAKSSTSKSAKYDVYITGQSGNNWGESGDDTNQINTIGSMVCHSGSFVTLNIPLHFNTGTWDGYSTMTGHMVIQYRSPTEMFFGVVATLVNIDGRVSGVNMQLITEGNNFRCYTFNGDSNYVDGSVMTATELENVRSAFANHFSQLFGWDCDGAQLLHLWDFEVFE